MCAPLPGDVRRRGGWRFALATLAGLAGLAVVKFWPLVRPWDRVFFGMDLSLGIEGHFYFLLKRGVAFLWDPTVVTGNLTIGGGLHHPQYAQGLFHLFYLPGLAVFGLAEREQHVPHIVLVWYQIAHYVAAGGFTTLYVRALGVGRAGSFVAGATFMLSTFLVAHVQHWLMVATAAWLPLALHSLRRAMVGPSLVWGALTGVPLAMSLQAGHPQIFLYVLTAVGSAWAFGLGEAVVDAGGLRRARAGLGRRVAALALAVLFTAALGALLVLPVLEGQIWTRQPPELYPFEWKSQGSLPPYLVAKLLVPNASAVLGTGDDSETGLYLGVLPLVLAILAALRVRARPVYFHAALGVAALVLAFGRYTPAFRLAYDLLPGFAANRYPSRILVLFAFSAAVLAGYGMDLLVSPRDPGMRATLLRSMTTLRCLLLVVTLLGVAVLVAGPADWLRAPQFETLAIDLTVLALLTAATLGVLGLAARDPASRALRGLAVTLALGDLLFWGIALGGGEGRSPDERLGDRDGVIALLRGDPGPFRLGMADTMIISAHHLYRHGWPVYDEEDRLLPLAVQDLFFLTQKNPRVLDLLNVKYVVGGKHRTALTKYARLDVSAGVPEKDLAVDSLGPVSTVRLASAMHDARGVPQGAPVATVTLEGHGDPMVLTVRAGIESAEWAWDHPFETRPAHDRGSIVRSWTVSGLGFQAHDYGAIWRLARPIPVARVRLRYLLPRGALVVPSLELDGTDLATRRDRFQPVHRLVEVNRHVLPRAFLVPGVRVISDRVERLAHLEGFDPAREAVLAEAPPGVDLAALTTLTPLEPGEGAEVLHTSFGRVHVRVTARRTRLLVVSDTWSRWWRATADRRPVPMLVADHALRGVVVAAGSHDVVFRFRYPIFPVAVASTLAGWGALGAVGVVAWRRRRLAVTPAPDGAVRDMAGDRP